MEHLTNNNKTLIVVAGPTAAGKTAISIELAKHLGSEIISCDSRQIYKELNIGVARPSEEELQTVKHYLIAHRSIHEPYNAGLYAEEANKIIRTLFQSNNYVVMTGGTGLYIKAALEGLDPLPTADTELRKELLDTLESRGLGYLQLIAENLGITRKDTDYNNYQRLIRAIEIVKSKKETTKRLTKKNFNILYFYINRDRSDLYDRINSRVDNMMAAGFEEEARLVYPYIGLNSLKTVGYNEIFSYFEGNLNRQDCVDKIKQKTRNYAKRQLTWFRNQGDYKEVKPILKDILINLP